mgnify:FL=1
MWLVGYPMAFLILNLNVRAKRTQKSSNAKLGEEWVPQQHPRADKIVSLQDHRLAGGILKKGMSPHIKASPFYTDNLKVQKLAESSQGQNSLQLIQELLQFYEMEHSLKIFTSESNTKNEIKW